MFPLLYVNITWLTGSLWWYGYTRKGLLWLSIDSTWPVSDDVCLVQIVTKLLLWPLLLSSVARHPMSILWFKLYFPLSLSHCPPIFYPIYYLSAQLDVSIQTRSKDLTVLLSCSVILGVVANDQPLHLIELLGIRTLPSVIIIQHFP